MSRRWSGNDFLVLISAMHFNNISDEGEALTCNPLATRRNSRKAFKSKRCNTRQLCKLSLFPKERKRTLTINDITTAIFIDFLIICCLFSVHQLFKGGIYYTPSWMLLIISQCFWNERNSTANQMCCHFPFFLYFQPQVRPLFLGGCSGFCCNQSQELWELQCLVFQNVSKFLFWLLRNFNLLNSIHSKQPKMIRHQLFLTLSGISWRVMLPQHYTAKRFNSYNNVSFLWTLRHNQIILSQAP